MRSASARQGEHQLCPLLGKVGVRLNDLLVPVMEPDGQIRVRRIEEAQRPLDTELPEQTQHQFPAGEAPR